MRIGPILTLLIIYAVSMPAFCETVGEIKKLPDGPSGTVTGVVTYINSGDCYIESSDRASGIWVQGDTTDISVGSGVVVSGSLSTVNGERLLTASEITPTGQHGSVTPLGMPLSRVGGSRFGFQDSVSDHKLVKVGDTFEWQWVTPKGLNNTGLLVTTWGKVTATSYSKANNLHWFHIDDSSGLTSDLNERGVIVYSDAEVKQGQFVSVTGISSVEAAIDDPTHLIRTIRPGSADDVQVQRDVVPDYPFSDEFDGDNVDIHWGEVGSELAAIGTLSVESGELRIYIPAENAEIKGAYSRQLVQSAEGDWDMEVKLRIVPTLLPQKYQCMGVALKAAPTDIVYEVGMSGYNVTTTWLAAILPQTSYNPDAITGRMQYVVAGMQVGYPKTELNTFAKTVWFKIRKRGSTVYGRASTDGVNYTQEYSTDCRNRCYLTLCGYSYNLYSSNITGPCTGYYDYIRFTRVDQ